MEKRWFIRSPVQTKFFYLYFYVIHLIYANKQEQKTITSLRHVPVFYIVKLDDVVIYKYGYLKNHHL